MTLICRICNAKISDPTILRAVISPWIREIIKAKSRLSKLILCSECGAAGFSYIYDSNEMDRLYSSYRGQEYTKIRSKWEKWYTTNYNSAHEKSEIIDSRIDIISEFIKRHVNKEIESILDVGGDDGKFFPKLNRDFIKLVLEKSNKELKPGVLRIKDLSEIDKIDLIIYAHVLEHVADPLSEVVKLMRKCNYLYIEVPIGIPSVSILRRSFFLQWLIANLSLFPKFWSYLSIPVAGRSVRPIILRQSEHLNFFTEKSLELLADRVNADFEISENVVTTPDLAVMNVYQVLLSKRPIK